MGHDPFSREKGYVPNFPVMSRNSALLGAGGRPEAPVAEGGPVGFSDGGNRRDWFPGVRGLRATSSAEWNHTNGNAYRDFRGVDEVIELS